MDDRGVLEHFPLPIARGYRRYLNASEVRERHDAAYYLFEIYLKYAASIAIALYLRGSRGPGGRVEDDRLRWTPFRFFLSG